MSQARSILDPSRAARAISRRGWTGSRSFETKERSTMDKQPRIACGVVALTLFAACASPHPPHPTAPIPPPAPDGSGTAPAAPADRPEASVATAPLMVEDATVAIEHLLALVETSPLEFIRNGTA